MRKLLLIGGGGHYRSVIDSLHIARYEETAILDARVPMGSQISGIPVIGNHEDAPALFEKGYTCTIITVGSFGNPSVRIELYQRYKAIGFEFPSIIEPTAIVSKNAVIGACSVVIRDIPGEVVAVGVPCKAVRQNE